jgi:hypothetical protein
MKENTHTIEKLFVLMVVLLTVLIFVMGGLYSSMSSKLRVTAKLDTQIANFIDSHRNLDTNLMATLSVIHNEEVNFRNCIVGSFRMIVISVMILMLVCIAVFAAGLVKLKQIAKPKNNEVKAPPGTGGTIQSGRSGS